MTEPDSWTSGLVLRNESGLPVYRQLVDQLRYLIQAGRYPPGSYLPAMRLLASELGLNLNTINRAYRQLQRDGLIRSTQGKGARVVEANVEGVHDEVDAILAAAVERALSSRLTPREVVEKVAAIATAFESRLPATPVAVAAGFEERSRLLAEGLASAMGRNVVAVSSLDDDATAPIVVRPRYGDAVPDDERLVDAGEGIPVAMVMSRASVERLLGLEPNARIVVVAFDEVVARWLADAVTIAGPVTTRWQTAQSMDEVALAPYEVVVAELGVSRVDGSSAVTIEAEFAGAARRELEGAIGDLQAGRRDLVRSERKTKGPTQ